MCTQQYLITIVYTTYTGVNMTTIQFEWEAKTLEITDTLTDNFRERSKTVGKHTRKSKEKIYESPKIILPSFYNRFIGRRYLVFTGQAIKKYKSDYSDKSIDTKGDILILFFPKSKKEE